MRIKCLTTFLEGRDRFEAGDVRTVPDADAARFIAAGWAADAADAVTADDQATTAGPVTLDINPGSHAAADTGA